MSHHHEEDKMEPISSSHLKPDTIWHTGSVRDDVDYDERYPPKKRRVSCGIEIVKCNICGYHFDSPAQLSDHLLHHDGDYRFNPIYKCSYGQCMFRTDDRPLMKHHIQRIHLKSDQALISRKYRNRKFLRPTILCNTCPMVFASESELWQHTPTCKEYRCQFCGKHFWTIEKRYSHELAYHEDEFEYDEEEEEQTAEEQCEEQTAEEQCEEQTAEEQCEEQTAEEQCEEQTAEEQCEEQTAEEQCDEQTAEEQTEKLNEEQSLFTGNTTEEKVQPKEPHDQPKEPQDQPREPQDQPKEPQDEQIEDVAETTEEQNVQITEQTGELGGTEILIKISDKQEETEKDDAAETEKTENFEKSEKISESSKSEDTDKLMEKIEGVEKENSSQNITESR